MDCETFAALPKDFKCTVLGNTIEHKDIIADFSNIFQNSQPELYNQYVIERCFTHVLSGRNIAHLVIDGNTTLFFDFCEHVILTALEESSRCRVKAYTVSSTANAMCLISKANLTPVLQAVKPVPFTKFQTVEVKDAQQLKDKVLSRIEENLPLSYDVICLSVGLDVIPVNRGPTVAKLFPEVAVLLLNSDNVHINKLITDLSNLSDFIAEKSVSTSVSANTIGFYLSGNFSCTSTIHFKHGLYKPQLLLAKSLRRIKTYPMVNDVYSMGFLKKMASVQPAEPAVDTNLLSTLRNDLKVMAQDNIKLMDDNKNLHSQIDRLNIEINNVMGSKDVISDELRNKLSDEQEIYNKLSEIAVERVKEQDMSEAKRYELMNKIFSLENDLMSSEIATTELQKKCDELKEENNRIENAKNDLQAEYITLKNNHKSVVGRHEMIERRCEQLSVELVQLHMENEELSKARSPLPGITKRIPLALPGGSDIKTAIFERPTAGTETPYDTSHVPPDKKHLLQEILSLRSELAMLKGGMGDPEHLGSSNTKDIIQKAFMLKTSNDSLNLQIKELKSSLNIAYTTRECAIEESERLRSSLSAANLTMKELEKQYKIASQKYKNSVEVYRSRLNSYIRDTEKILQKLNPSPLLRKQIAAMIKELEDTYIAKERELQEKFEESNKDYLDVTERYNKLNEEIKHMSGRRAIQVELTKLRKELQSNKQDIARGKLVPSEKLEDMLTEQQAKYQERINVLQNRTTVAEAQLKRIMHFLDRRTFG